MSDETKSAPVEPQREVNWTRRLVIGAVALVATFVLTLILSAFLPRWWAVRIGGQVDQSAFNGVALGLFYGIVFTFIPLLVLWIGFRRRRTWKVWLMYVLVALLLAAPNLLTLSIVVGRGNAAHAGERILDTQAGYFRASTAVGAVIAALLMAFTAWVMTRRTSVKRKEQRLKEDRAAFDRERTAASPDDAGE